MYKLFLKPKRFLSRKLMFYQETVLKRNVFFFLQVNTLKNIHILFFRRKRLLHRFWDETPLCRREMKRFLKRIRPKRTRCI